MANQHVLAIGNVNQNITYPNQFALFFPEVTADELVTARDTRPYIKYEERMASGRDGFDRRRLEGRIKM